MKHDSTPGVTITLRGSQLKKVRLVHFVDWKMTAEEWIRANEQVTHASGKWNDTSDFSLDGVPNLIEVKDIQDEDVRWAFELHSTSEHELRQRFPTATYEFEQP